MISGKQVGPLDFGPGALGWLLDQLALASGSFATPGDAEAAWLVLRGQTPGVAPGESVELRYEPDGSGWFTLQDGFAYTLQFSGIAVSAGGVDLATFESQEIPILQNAGVITSPVAVPAPAVRATARAVAWTLSSLIGVAGVPPGSPTRISMTFTDTGSTAVVRCVALARLIKVAQP